MRGPLAALACVVALLVSSTSLAADGGRLEVRVVDEFGTPVAFAAVSLYGAPDTVRQHGTTDLAGSVEFTGLSLGQAYLLESAASGSRFSRPVTLTGDASVRIELRTLRAASGDRPVAGTPWTASSAVDRTAPESSHLRREPSATAPIAASLGAWFRSSELDGSGAHGEPRVSDPSFATVQPWLRLAGLHGDRLSYRLAAHASRDQRPVALGGEIPHQTLRDSTIDANLAWQLSPRNRVALDYRNQRLEFDRLGLSTIQRPDSTPALDLRSNEFGLTWSAPVATQVDVRSRISWREGDERLFPTEPARSNACLQGDGSSLTPLLTGARCQRIDRQRFSGSYHRDAQARSERFALQSVGRVRNLSWLGARHTVSAAFAVANEQLRQQHGLRAAARQNEFDAVFGPDGAASVPEPISLTEFTVGLDAGRTAPLNGVTWALDLEDVLVPAPGWSITIGARVLRTERSVETLSAFDPSAEQQRFFERLAAGADPDAILDEGVFTAYEGIAGLADEVGLLWRYPDGAQIQPDRPPLLASAGWPRRRVPESVDWATTDLAPRVAASWNVPGRRQSRVSVAARRFHEPAPLEAIALALTPPTYTESILAQPVTGGPAIPTGVADVEPQLSAPTLRRDLRAARVDGFEVRYERELGLHTSLRLGWIETRRRDALRTRDLNNLPGDFGRCHLGPEIYPGSLYSSAPPLTASPGSGFEVTDPFTGEVYVDTDPGIGDGRLDDCRGSTRFRVPQNEGQSLFADPLERPDGRPDLYKQNPAWGPVIELGNTGWSDRESAVLEFERRPASGWHALVRYTWSKHRGNHDRLATFGDFDAAILTEVGAQPSDRRHEFEVLAGADLRRGYRLAGHLSWLAGLPYSVFEQAWSYDAIPEAYGLENLAAARHRLLYVGERNAARNRDRWRLDLLATRSFRIKGGALELSLAVDNVFDDGTLEVYNADLGTGFQINGISDARREFGRRYRLGAAAHW